MNRYLFRAAFAISSMISAFAPLYAAAPVTDDPLAAWVQNINKKVEDEMVDPANDSSGIVRIDFRRSSEGKPIDIVIHAANSDLRAAAQRTIARVGILPPLPVGYDPGERIGMQLLFSDGDEDAYLRQRAEMLASATRANQQLALTRSETRVAVVTPRQ